MTKSVNSAYGVAHGDVSTAMSKFFQQLGSAGATVVHQLKTSPAFARRLAKYAMAGTYGKPTTMERAREIMGDNFISPEAVEHALAHKYTPLEMSGFDKVPFPEEDLESVAETHLLVPGVGFTIDQLYERTRMNLRYMWDPTTWCWKGQHASSEIVGSNWILIRKGPVPGTLGKSWSDGQEMISYKEVAPRACELFFAMIINYLTNDGEKRTFMRNDDYYELRCIDEGRKGWWLRKPRHVSVHELVGSIHPDNDTLDSAQPRIGFASRWRLPSEI